MKHIFMIIIIVGGIYHYWNKYEENKLFNSSLDSNGFVKVIMPAGTSSNKVYINAPLNCPREAGQRADALERELRRRGIPFERRSRISVNTPATSEEVIQNFKNTVRILNGEVPAVFVNGMAKSNPGIEDLIAEFNRSN